MGITLKTTTGKIIASVALVGTAAGVAGLGTFGAFTSTTSASQAVTAGTVTIALPAAGVDNTLNVPVTGMLPGDKVEKLVKLSNTGNSDLNNVTLATDAGTTGSLLTTDGTNGLQLAIENCSVPWSGTAGAYTCTGTQSTVLASGPIITGPAKTLANLTALTSAKTDNLKVTTALPATADNTFQGLTSTVGFTFTATQRTAVSK
ncbi:TasA family protein [Pseudarthrobacter sp. NPDC058119]|uniref:TasA family protein n=1 Tax=Pseudarthrobacter sp. NPDC058119 TaxID=3346348 RepID=UPI0036DF915C